MKTAVQKVAAGFREVIPLDRTSAVKAESVLRGTDGMRTRLLLRSASDADLQRLESVLVDWNATVSRRLAAQAALLEAVRSIRAGRGNQR